MQTVLFLWLAFVAFRQHMVPNTGSHAGQKEPVTATAPYATAFTRIADTGVRCAIVLNAPT